MLSEKKNAISEALIADYLEPINRIFRNELLLN